MTIDKERLVKIRAREERRVRSNPLRYVAMLPRLTEVARANGYTLAVHGSLVRDCDLIAVPWVPEAVSANELAQAIIEASGGFLVEHPKQNFAGVRDPAQKPHNRLAWSIHLEGGDYIDLSVTPRCTGCGA